MARFYGEVGYGETVEQAPGVFEDVIIPRKYRGDVVRNARGLRDGDKVNSDITVSNSISIVADAYAYENFMSIKYVVWAGVYWIVTDVEVERPRLVLRLGGMYNGPKASTP